MALRKGIFESETSLVIASNLKHKKKQNKHWCFLSMSFKALTLFADVKRKVLKTQMQFDYSVKRYDTFKVVPCVYNVLEKR